MTSAYRGMTPRPGDWVLLAPGQWPFNAPQLADSCRAAWWRVEQVTGPVGGLFTVTVATTRGSVDVRVVVGLVTVLPADPDMLPPRPQGRLRYSP